MKKFSTIAILALMFVGCNNNFDTVEPTVEGTPMTIVATTADEAAEGRTALNTADGKTVVWKTGDKLGVFCEYMGTVADANDKIVAQHVDKYQQTYTLTGSDGTTNGVFEGTSSHAAYVEDTSGYGIGGVYRFHAYYPLNDANASVLKGNLTGTLAKVQSYDVTAEYNDMSANDLLIGKYLTGTKEDTSIPLTFEHVFAMMNFEISSAEALTVHKVEMIAEGVSLSGAYTINITRNINANKNGEFEFKNTKNLNFTTGNVSVGVNVKNGQIAAEGTITARLIFNRWAATDGLPLTVKVYTDKGMQTFNKTATDFAGKNNWGLRLALDTSDMDKDATIDNYDSATMTAMDANIDYITAGGTYCVVENITRGTATSIPIKTTEDITIIGGSTQNGVPKVSMKAGIVANASSNGGNSVVVRDLIWSASQSSYVFRVNNAKGNLKSLVIENCIIDCESKGGAPFILCDANYSIESITIRNCKFENLAANYVISFDAVGVKECTSFVFENNTISTTNGKDTVQKMIKGTLPANSTIENNTIVTTEAATLSLKWATEEI